MPEISDGSSSSGAASGDGANATNYNASDAATRSTSYSKLLVGPAFLTRLITSESRWREAFGRYWVVAVGPSSNQSLGYDWAIVSGGPPEAPSGGACSTASSLAARLAPSGLGGGEMADVGLWLFSRQPVADEATLQAMRDEAAAIGFDLGVLVSVKQAGCKYEGASKAVTTAAAAAAAAGRG